MRFMQIESVLQTINRSEPAKNRFSVALGYTISSLCEPDGSGELKKKTVDPLTRLTTFFGPTLQFL